MANFISMWISTQTENHGGLAWGSKKGYNYFLEEVHISTVTSSLGPDFLTAERTQVSPEDSGDTPSRSRLLVKIVRGAPLAFRTRWVCQLGQSLSGNLCLLPTPPSEAVSPGERTDFWGESLNHRGRFPFWWLESCTLIEIRKCFLVTW